MAKSKTKKVKKASKPAKKQVVAKKTSKNKTTEKKAVKKIILTTEKKAKKVAKTTPVKVKKAVKKSEPKKTKKIVDKETKPVLTSETKSEAKKPEDILKTSSDNEQKSITPVAEETEKKVEQAPVVETKPVVEEKKEVVQPKNIGILPVDDDDDDKLKDNIMNTMTNVQKVFTFKKGIEFMDGHLKIGIDGTNISRRNDLIFDVYGKSEQGAEFKTEFECIDKEEGDFFMNQLIECEKNNAPFMKGTPTDTAATEQNKTPDLTKSHALDANGNIDMTKLSAAEIMSIQNGNMDKVKEEPKKDFTGIPLSNVNIDDMINNLPPKTENQNINPVGTTTQSNSADISNILNNQNAAQIEAYGKSIEDLINSSFQANVWGGMPQNDARLFLKNCDAQYTYELISDGTGFFIKMKKDTIEVRIPKNPTEYLKVK